MKFIGRNCCDLSWFSILSCWDNPFNFASFFTISKHQFELHASCADLCFDSSRVSDEDLNKPKRRYSSLNLLLDLFVNVCFILLLSFFLSEKVFDLGNALVFCLKWACALCPVQLWMLVIWWALYS